MYSTSTLSIFRLFCCLHIHCLNSNLTDFFRIDAGTGESLVKSRDSIDLHKWHKIRLARDSTEMRLYINNQEAVSELNKGDYKTINLNKKMYVGTVFTEDTTLRYVIKLIFTHRGWSPL